MKSFGLSRTTPLLAALTMVGAAAQPPARPPGAVTHAQQVSAIRAAARAIAGDSGYEALLAAAGQTRRVMLGEQTHGTHEFYRERGRLTERLIRDHGFNAVAIEGDWSPTWRVNQYVRGLGSDRSAEQALGGYGKFPRWMWRNAEFRDFVERLRALNLSRPPAERVGLYGMDVYDLFDAADAAIAYLQRSDPAAAARARQHYRCFARYDRDPQAYGQATRLARRSCQTQAAAVLDEVRRLPRPSDPQGAEQHFGAIRSAASVAAGEEYFRTLYSGAYAWNARDQQMERNVEAIAAHAQALSGRPGKVVVWSHNSHTGDARATSAARRGELNLGQLMRQRHGDQALLVGFFTHSGTVMAATEWDFPGRRFEVMRSLPHSHGMLFHDTGIPAFALMLRGQPALRAALSAPMLQRAIGVIYRSHLERSSHYFEANLPQQFDAAVFFDRTQAVTPVR